MALHARNKGKRGERQVVDLLQPVVDRVRSNLALQPLLLKRNALQSHAGGEDLVGIAGFAVEVKFVEAENLESWWSQAVRQATTKQAVPVLFFRASKQKWRVAVQATVLAPCQRHRAAYRVIFSQDDFMRWFESAYTEVLCYFLKTSPHIAHQIT